ncbi:hypothetical protein M231_02973 [Tremella mesenterica]|uniref:Uncharacterized protein n=1 Tax=Tremella mesenterica TaxID=5217 RepID=A0A4Q1BPN5_TREME|nr:hypothetical protein M231_02973 [Tremella mesenterica]
MATIRNSIPRPPPIQRRESGNSQYSDVTLVYDERGLSDTGTDTNCSPYNEKDEYFGNDPHVIKTEASSLDEVTFTADGADGELAGWDIDLSHLTQKHHCHQSDPVDQPDPSHKSNLVEYTVCSDVQYIPMKTEEVSDWPTVFDTDEDSIDETLNLNPTKQTKAEPDVTVTITINLIPVDQEFNTGDVERWDATYPTIMEQIATEFKEKKSKRDTIGPNEVIELARAAIESIWVEKKGNALRWDDGKTGHVSGMEQGPMCIPLTYDGFQECDVPPSEYWKHLGNLSLLRRTLRASEISDMTIRRECESPADID